MQMTLTHPCPQCPFRTDIPPYLYPARVRQIEASLVHGVFPCHKTTDWGDGDDGDGDTEYVPTGEERHCAGALILLEKTGRPSQWMRISGRLGDYDRRKLNMAAPVFNSWEAMTAAQHSPQ